LDEKDKLDEVLDELLKDCKSSEEIVGKNGLLFVQATV